MKKRCFWVCIALLLLVSGVILTAWLEPTQTVRGYFAGDAFYRGRPTRYWRECLLAGELSATQYADNILQFKNTQEAFPVLRECASAPDWRVRRRAIALLSLDKARSEPILSVLVGTLDDEEREVRLEGIRALGRWGPMARLAVPALASRLNDPEIEVALYADIALWAVDRSAALRESGWKPFRSDAWKFTVMLPNEPEHSEPSIPFADAHIFLTLHKAGSCTGATCYAVGVSEFPAEWLEGKDKADILAKERDSTVERFGKLIGEQPIEQNGWKGTEQLIEVGGKGIDVRRRLFWVDNRLYQIYVSAGKPELLNVRAADYFIESFQLDRKGAAASGSPHPQQQQHRE